jgi:hypothetical protein
LIREVVKMTTATTTLGTTDVPSIETDADLVRAIVRDRWRQATTRPVRREGERGFAGANSKAWERILYGLEELGARLLEGCEADGYGEQSEYDSLEDTVWNTLDNFIQDTLIDWAVAVELRNRAKRAAAADYLAPYMTE